MPSRRAKIAISSASSRQARPQVTGDLPAHDLAGEQVGDERRVHKTAGRGHIRDIRDPPAVRLGRREVTLQRSAGLPAAPAGTVVRGFFRPATAPAMPSSRISRSTVHRATSMPSRRNCNHIFRAPYRPRPFLRLSHAHDLLFQVFVPDPARRRLAPPDGIIGRDREFQDRAHRLDTEPVTMRIGEPD
jgi:hypothetical protein